MSRRASQKNVGVIGLGIIGRRVADCLRHRGFHVFVWNRTPRPFPNFVGSPAEIAELCDFIQIFVSNDEALLQMIQAMKPSLKAHHVVMAHSTVAPATVREAAEVVQRRGGRLLDAPFTGSKGAAEKGELVYYIGGDDAAYRRARPVLEGSSKEIIEIGEIGDAMTIKVATNLITAASVQVAAEALALVDRAQIPLEKFVTAMRSNGSNSATLTMKFPKMLTGDYETQFSVKHMLKDVEIASRLARAYDLRLDVVEVARRALIEEAERGGADDDYSAVAREYFPQPPSAREREQGPAHAERELEFPAEPEHQDEPAQRNGSEDEPERESERAEVEEVESPAEPEPIAEQEPNESERETEPVAAVGEPAEEEVQSDEAESEPEEIGNASTAVEVETAEPVVGKPEQRDEEEAPRGFFSRFFGRGTDY